MFSFRQKNLSYSLNEAKKDYALAGLLHGKNIKLTKDEINEYLSSFIYELGINEEKAIARFIELRELITN